PPHRPSDRRGAARTRASRARPESAAQSRQVRSLRRSRRLRVRDRVPHRRRVPYRRSCRRLRSSQHGDRSRSEEPRRMKRKVERQLRFLERPLPWLTLALITVLFVAALGFVVDFGLFEHVDRELLGAPLRGYTLIGLASGVFALLSLGVVLM